MHMSPKLLNLSMHMPSKLLSSFRLVVTTLFTGYHKVNIMQYRMEAGVKVSNISGIRI